MWAERIHFESALGDCFKSRRRHRITSIVVGVFGVIVACVNTPSHGQVVSEAAWEPEPTREDSAVTALGSAEAALPVLVYDDATVARGAAGPTIIEAPVFRQTNDSGFGWFMKADDVFGLGTWANQMILGNGFEPGDKVTGYDLLIRTSVLSDPSVNTSVMVELWDGDPGSGLDVDCTTGGVSAPIPGTQAIFTDLPLGDFFTLRATLAEPVQIDCDRVWMVATMLEGCRATWQIAGSGGSTFNEPPEIGSSDAVWLQWSCEQFDVCDTPNGYATGTCCGSNVPCDHTDGDFECSTGHPTFCGAGVVDSSVLTEGAPDDYHSLVGTIFSPAEATMSLVPVSIDARPDGSGPAPGRTLLDTDVVLQEGGHTVWFELRIGDWDPRDRGRKLQAWRGSVDSSSFTSGTAGTLQYYMPPCLDDLDCAEQIGPNSTCAPPAFFGPPNTCVPLSIDTSRPDYVFADVVGTAILGYDLSTPDMRWTSAVLPPPLGPGPIDDPDPFPETGLYAGTVPVTVPLDAEGTFTIRHLNVSILTGLQDENNQFIPRVAAIPAKITVTTDCVAASTPEAEFIQRPVGIQELSEKNRFLTFQSPDFGSTQAVRVTFVDLPPPFDVWDGSQLWVTEPKRVSQLGGTIAETPDAPGFWAATLQCQPVFTEWGSRGFVHVFHEGIVPGGTYEIQLISKFCDPNVELDFSAPLTVTTPAKWGDVVRDFTTSPPGAPNGVVQILDVIAILNRLVSTPDAVVKARADVEPGCLDLLINISDVLRALEGWQGLPYPFAPSTVDPCDSPCVNPLPS